MKKGLKVLSAVLALSMGLISASLVSAVEIPSKGPHLSKEAQDLLKIKETAAKTNPFYTKWSDKKEYLDALKQADAAYQNLKADSEEWARLSVLACEALREIESINNQLAAVPHLQELAEDTVMELTEENKVDKTVITGAKDGDAGKRVPDEAQNQKVELPAGTLVHKSDLDALNKAIEENEKLATSTDLKKTETGVISLVKTNEEEQLKASAKTAVDLAAKILAPAYKDAAKYVAKFGEDTINETVIKELKANKLQLNGIVAFVAKIAKDNGLTLEDCALPVEATGDKADEKVTGEKKEEAKKDAVPDTAAFFKPMIPCCYTKVVVCENGVKKVQLVPGEKCKKPAKKAAFTFEQLRSAELLESCCNMK